MTKQHCDQHFGRTSEEALTASELERTTPILSPCGTCFPQEYLEPVQTAVQNLDCLLEQARTLGQGMHATGCYRRRYDEGREEAHNIAVAGAHLYGLLETLVQEAVRRAGIATVETLRSQGRKTRNLWTHHAGLAARQGYGPVQTPQSPVLEDAQDEQTEFRHQEISGQQTTTTCPSIPSPQLSSPGKKPPQPGCPHCRG